MDEFFEIPFSFPLRLDAVPLDGLENLIMMSALPGSKYLRTKRNLILDLMQLHQHDVTDIVCLLTQDEFTKFKVPDLLSEYEKAGFKTIHYPIEVGGFPMEIESFRVLLLEILDLVKTKGKGKGKGKNKKKKRKVLIHCFGGVGRTGLFAACLKLVHNISFNFNHVRNLAVRKIVEELKALRGPDAIQNTKQWEFIVEFRKFLLLIDAAKDITD